MGSCIMLVFAGRYTSVLQEFFQIFQPHFRLQRQGQGGHPCCTRTGSRSAGEHGVQIARIIPVCSQPVGHQYPACLLPAIGSQLEIAAWETAKKCITKIAVPGLFSLIVDSTNGEHQRTGRIAIMPDIFIAVSGSEEHGTAFSISSFGGGILQSEPGMVRKRVGKSGFFFPGKITVWRTPGTGKNICSLLHCPVDGFRFQH